MNSREQKAQSLVEFSIMLPMLVLLLVGTIQFGIIMAHYLAVNHAAVVGARTASVASSQTDAVNNGSAAAKAAAGSFIKNTNGLNVAVTAITVGSPASAAEQVTVSYNLKLIFAGFGFPSPMPIKGTCIMRREQ